VILNYRNNIVMLWMPLGAAPKAGPTANHVGFAILSVRPMGAEKVYVVFTLKVSSNCYSLKRCGRLERPPSD
jgi:hypothetical protein